MDKSRVLLIDDEEELVITLVERLGYRGWIARYATNGPDALQRMEEEAFDIVVIDMKMPGMSGNEVFREMQKRQYNLPVLMITGHGAPVGGEEDEEINGETDYLAKPINIEDLIVKMEETIAATRRTDDN